MTETSDNIPSTADLDLALAKFQGEIDQIPPMFSAKKIKGKKLCDLARQGKTVERAPSKVFVEITLLHYEYPYIDIKVKCSKGTYIRSLAHDLGMAMGCYGHLIELMRTRSGKFSLEECIDGNLLDQQGYDLFPHLRKMA